MTVATSSAPGMCETELSLEEPDGPTRWLCVIAGYEGHDDDGAPVDRWITLGTSSDSARLFEPMHTSARLTSREARRVGEALLDAVGFAEHLTEEPADPEAAA